MENVFYWGNLILSYGVSGYVMLKFMFELFEPKYKKHVYIIAWIAFVVAAICFNETKIAILKSIYGIIASCIIGVVLFKSPSKRKIVGVAIFFFLYLLIVDALSVLLFTIFSGKSLELVQGNSILLFVCGLCNQAMLLCFYKPMIGIMKKHQFEGINRQQNIFLIILALFETLLFIYISGIIDNTSNSIVLILLTTSFLGFDIYLIYLFEAISQKYALENEMELRDQQLSMQSNYYHSIETQYDNSRRLIHDMKNHMQTLEELYNSGSGLEARNYAQTILKSMDSFSGRFKCRNRILTIILNDKILKCDEQGININVEVEDIDFDFIDPFDMTTIFSNLLDNAIEACSKISIKKRNIKLRVFKFNGFVTISIRNRYNGRLVWDRENLVSTKGGKHMGLGLKNVKSAVEKYDGVLQRKNDDEYFEVKILMSPKA
ncbi:sensor histidine kinase [Eubacterium limosum]|uniref:sensor histidine kinase n=1 Tax=Eubacterium limosum TaxID=1736 RepID=UPI003720701E